MTIVVCHDIYGKYHETAASVLQWRSAHGVMIEVSLGLPPQSDFEVANAKRKTHRDMPAQPLKDFLVSRFIFRF